MRTLTSLKGQQKLTESKALGKDEDVKKLLKAKEQMINRAAEKNKELEKKLGELESDLEKTKSVYEEKLSEAKAAIPKKPESPVLGECIGGIIEEDNRKLQSMLHEAQLKIEELSKKINIKNDVEQHDKQNLGFPVKNESNVSIPELLAIGDLPETEKCQNLKKRAKDVKEFSDVRDCDTSSNSNATSRHLAGSASIEVPFTEHANVPIVNGDIGSLWSQYNVSSSENENKSEGTPFMDNGLTKILSIYKQLRNELSDKLNSLMHLFSSLRALLVPNGSNGCVDYLQILKKLEEDLNSAKKSVSCLFHIVESQVKFQNNNSISKDYIMTDKVECKCDSSFSEAFEHLKMENEKLKSKMPKINQNFTYLLRKKEEKISQLLKNFSSLEAQHQEVLKSRQTLSTQQEELFKTIEDLKLKLKEMENCKIKYSYLKSESKKKFDYEITKRRNIELKCQKLEVELRDTVKKEKDIRRKCKQEAQCFKMDIENFKCKYQILEKNQTLLRAEKKDLCQRIEDMEVEMREKNIQQKAQSCGEENIVLASDKGIKVEIKEENTNYGFSESESISNLNEVTSQDTGNESTLSGALYSRSLHSGLHLYTDDEEGFLNHSSIANIKKEYENADVQTDERLQELKRRNTLCLPHLQSSYPAELQSVSLYERDDNAEIRNSDNPENNGHIAKKRKVSEMETESTEMQSSKILATPSRIRPPFKTPTSLHKLFNFRRNRRPGSIKPKP